MSKNDPYPNFYFLIPDPTSVISGGNIYNQFLIQSLQDLGLKASIIEHFPKGRKAKNYIIVDTLFLDQLETNFNQEEDKTILLVHHLESLYPPPDYSAKKYFEKFERKKLEQFDALLTTSFFTKKYLQQCKVSLPILVVPPALTFQPKIIPRSNNRIQAVLVANLVTRKGILPFLKMLNKIHTEKLTDLHIDIIGTDKIDPDYAAKCLAYIQDHPHLQKIITYQGEQSPTSLKGFYQKVNLFISTSFMETFGMALQEAVAFQLPILALDRGNVSFHIKHGQNGFLYQTMEDLVESLISLNMDKKQFQKLQQTSITFQPYQNYVWKDAALSFKQQMESLADPSATPTALE